MKRALGIASGLAALLAGVIAAVFSFKAIFLGAFLGLVGLWQVLPVVLLAVVAVGLPFFLGLGAIVLSIRRDTSALGAVVGVVGVVVAIVVGSVLAHAGERMKPDPQKAEKPRPAECKVVTTDTSAINRTCTQEGFAGDCPPEYACNRTMAGLYGDKSKPQLACEIRCTHDCMCPSGTTCRNATCQRGKDLPP